jgi:hypothetical protein
MQRRKNKKENEREKLFQVKERGLLKKCLPGPTLLEMSGFGVYQALAEFIAPLVIRTRLCWGDQNRTSP